MSLQLRQDRNILKVVARKEVAVLALKHYVKRAFHLISHLLSTTTKSWVAAPSHIVAIDAIRRRHGTAFILARMMKNDYWLQLLWQDNNLFWHLRWSANVGQSSVLTMLRRKNVCRTESDTQEQIKEESARQCCSSRLKRTALLIYSGTPHQRTDKSFFQFNNFPT